MSLVYGKEDHEIIDEDREVPYGYYQKTETVEVWKGHRGEENNRHTK